MEQRGNGISSQLENFKSFYNKYISMRKEKKKQAGSTFIISSTILLVHELQ